MIISEFSKDPFKFKTKQNDSAIKTTLKYIEVKLLDHFPNPKILDIGRRSPMTDAIAERFDLFLDNTEGDLDENFTTPKSYYNVIIFSHTIEHLFNPLHTLRRIKQVMDASSRLYIMTPDRGKILWGEGHFHEIDEYRMRLLIKRAGLMVVSKTKLKAWRPWYQYFKGFRSFLRLIIEWNSFYEVKLKS